MPTWRKEGHSRRRGAWRVAAARPFAPNHEWVNAERRGRAGNPDPESGFRSSGNDTPRRDRNNVDEDGSLRGIAVA